MEENTLGKWLERLRMEQAVSQSVLAQGLCDKKFLQKVECGQADCGLEIVTLWLQRLGKSADKLEYVLSQEEYQKERLRDLFMVCVFRKKRRLAERVRELYCQASIAADRVFQMYEYRERAMLAYWLEQDAHSAQQYLEHVLDLVSPVWREPDWSGWRLAIVELENILALARMYEEQGIDATRLLENCERYISQYVTDQGEHAKIYSKYAWLKARQLLAVSQPEAALELCMQALKELGECGIGYFAEALLKCSLDCYKMLHRVTSENIGENARQSAAGVIWLSEYECEKCLKAKQNLQQKYGKEWYPENSMFWNCFQRTYHLDYDIFRAEHQASGMTQEEIIVDIYQNPKEIWKIEKKHQSPHPRQFALLMERFGLYKRRRTGLIVSDSYAVHELYAKLREQSSRQHFETVEFLLQEFEQHVDANIPENRRVIAVYRNLIAMQEKLRQPDEILAEDIAMLQETYHITLEDIKRQTTLLSPKRRKSEWKKERVYRAPFRNEMTLLNQIVILLEQMGRKEEAIEILEGAVHILEQGEVSLQYQYHAYVLLMGNLAYMKGSIEDSEKALRLTMLCGKLNHLGDDYLTIACAMLGDNTKQTVCQKMIQDCYYLLVLSRSLKEQRIIANYYKEKFGQNVKEEILFNHDLDQ